MNETEVHPDDPHTDALSDRMRRLERAVLSLRDEFRASQSVPPRWITSRWRDIVYILILLLMAFGGDVKGALGYAVGSLTGVPPVVSPVHAPAPVAPESP